MMMQWYLGYRFASGIFLKYLQGESKRELLTHFCRFRLEKKTQCPPRRARPAGASIFLPGVNFWIRYLPDAKAKIFSRKKTLRILNFDFFDLENVLFANNFQKFPFEKNAEKKVDNVIWMWKQMR